MAIERMPEKSPITETIGSRPNLRQTIVQNKRADIVQRRQRGHVRLRNKRPINIELQLRGCPADGGYMMEILIVQQILLSAGDRKDMAVSVCTAKLHRT